MTKQTYLAFDLGAESGRGMLAGFDGERLSLAEAGRFPTTRGEADLHTDGVRRWDIARIQAEMWGILERAEADHDGALAGVGVDTWGVDYGLFNEDGDLLDAPVQYRDDSHARAKTDVLERISPEALWRLTGIQHLPFNTLFQLAALQKRTPRLLDEARHLLLMPDLLHHFLTDGAALHAEATIASTTQMLHPGAATWNIELLDRLGLPSHFLRPTIAPGTRVGATAGGTPVYAPAGHDTASAVAAVPVDQSGSWAFLSSGTWSLLGVERMGPELSLDALHMGLSNERGVADTTRLLKNIMGLWLVQECRRALNRSENSAYDYTELTALAAAAPPGSLFDATDTRFLAPKDMPGEIRAACIESGQPAPSDVGALIRCCLESLALAYRTTLHHLETLLGMKFEALYIVGGGGKNALLNQWAADACGIPVIVGASEATAVGNVLGQLIGAGAVADWTQARQVALNSFPCETHLPDPSAHARWQERAAAYEEMKTKDGPACPEGA